MATIAKLKVQWVTQVYIQDPISPEDDVTRPEKHKDDHRGSIGGHILDLILRHCIVKKDARLQ